MQQSISYKVSQLFQNSIVKWFSIILVLCIDLYLVVAMYYQGEYLFAIFTLLIFGSGVYIFASKKVYSWRYVYPGLMGMTIFILFPLAYTITIAFTNYSGSNQLSFERALTVLEQQSYYSGEKYNFKLYPAGGDQWQITLTNGDSHYRSDYFSFGDKVAQLEVNNSDPTTPVEKLRTIIQNRSALGELKLVLPNGNELSMSSLRQFSEKAPRYTYNTTTQILHNNETDNNYKPNPENGFFQQIDAQGQWLPAKPEPGYTVAVGWKNFIKIFTNKGIQKPFFSIFIWTVIFSLLTVIFTVAIGMVLACVVQWEALRGKAIYRLLLILPYAVPAFISILIFKGLFNQSYGEINTILQHIIGIKLDWFNSPYLAKTMVLIVNTWLGYPYMMILCMGILKAIPQDLYEASAMDGANTVQNFTKITAPLLFKPLIPLMIASFAFNFNNFVLIQLLTKGGPDMIGTTTPAGYTDLLVSYTYRIAFEGSGSQDFGLAAAIATIIFLLVGGLALLNLKASKMKLD